MLGLEFAERVYLRHKQVEAEAVNRKERQVMSIPSVSVGVDFQNPRGYQIPGILKSLRVDGTVQPPFTFVGSSSASTFSIQPTTDSNQEIHQRMAESGDEEPTDMEGRLCIIKINFMFPFTFFKCTCCCCC